MGDYNGNRAVEQGDLDLVLLNWCTETPPIPAGWTANPPEGLIGQEELDSVLPAYSTLLAGFEYKPGQTYANTARATRLLSMVLLLLSRVEP